VKPFAYKRADSIEDAVNSAATPEKHFLGGGTNLVDLMREGIARPSALIDVSSLSREIEERPDGSLLIGAGATNTQVAGHLAVRRRYPVLAQAILHGASGQIRNMATVGGNLLQRTRCLYFYDHAARCNKRDPGTGCDAIGGHNRQRAILGASAHCVATHPSDMCVGLAALDAIVHLQGPAGARTIDFVDLHRLPDQAPHLDTSIAPGELIVGVELPPLSLAIRSTYRKVRERASYAFALVSVAALLEIEGGLIRYARLALGGVAHKPWRASASEDALVGVPATAESFAQAADLALAEAEPLRDNGFKIPLARSLIAATLQELADEECRA
jgi:xanthine dehydrogenase YagS FAD-binding subunit